MSCSATQAMEPKLRSVVSVGRGEVVLLGTVRDDVDDLRLLWSMEKRFANEGRTDVSVSAGCGCD